MMIMPFPNRLPPLETGDRLSLEEFERRYQAMPNLPKAELIEGVVYVPSPVSYLRHGQPHIRLATWLGTYEAGTAGVLAGDNSSVRLDLSNAPQPDLLLFIDPDCGGHARISEDDFVEGSPELVVEVAASSVSLDLGAKLQAYQRSEVLEYFVYRVLDKQVDWFILNKGTYERLQPDGTGIYRSPLFGGLWLDAEALLAGDMARVLSVVQQGLASPDHAALIARLKQPG